MREAESARAAAAQQLEEMRAQTAKSMAGPAPDVQTPELDARLLAQKQNLDALLQRYTDGHPDVIRTRTLIADLEGQKRKEIDVLRRKLQQTGEVPIAQVNPAAVELSRIYSAAQVQVASLRARG